MLATVSDPDPTITPALPRSPLAVSLHAARLTTRLAGHRVRTSECAIIRAVPELTEASVDRGMLGRWVILRVTRPTGEETILELQLLTSPQHLGGERRWFACPQCGRRVRDLLSPFGVEPFGCRACHRLLYDSQWSSRRATTAAARAWLRFTKATARLDRRRSRPPGAPAARSRCAEGAP